MPVKKVTEADPGSPTKSPAKHRKNKSNLNEFNEQNPYKKKGGTGKLSLKIK